MSTNHLPKSRFITILSIVSIIASFYFIVENISTLSMQNNPEFQIVKQLMPSAIISPTAILFEILLNVATIIASIGLFMRLNWGRLLYMVMLVFVTVWEIYSSINSYLAFNKLLSGYGFGSSLSLILFWSIIGVFLNSYLIWKLSSSNIKSEFWVSKSSHI